MKRMGLWTALIAGILAGCNKEQLRFKGDDEVREKPAIETVGTLTSVRGMMDVQVFGVGIVQGLAGTGHEPQPGELRRKALHMLSQHGVPDGEGFLKSGSAAVVIVSGHITAGARKTDPFDVTLTLEPSDKTSSLRGGNLLECELREYTDIAQFSRDGAQGSLAGKVLAKAEGPVLVEIAHGSNKIDERRGQVWGGGRATQERNFALLLNAKNKDARTAKLIADRINERFYASQHGSVRGMAEAKNDTAITLRVPEQYRHNWPRYMRVVRQIPLRETAGGRAQYQRMLAEQLLDPAKTVTAALKLEGLGVEGVREDLKKGLGSQYAIVRFCSAESLAYLGDPAGAKTLAEIVRKEPSLRAYALTALASLDEGVCQLELRELMLEPSAETRYGAFRALLTLNAKEAIGIGEKLNDSFYLHRVAGSSTGLIHATTSRRPEVVLFGDEAQLLPPFSLTPGADFVITAADGDDRCLLTHISRDATKHQEYCSLKLDEIIRQMGNQGASYSDVVDLLQQASRGQNLSCPFAVDALPQAPTVYAIAAAGAVAEADGGPNADLGSTPNLFAAPAKKQ